VGTLPLREGCQVRSAEFYIFSILTIGDSMRGIWTVSPFQSSRRSFEDPAFVMRCERRRTYTCNFFFGGGGSDPLCLSSSLAFHFFRLFFSCPPPCQPEWPAYPCTCNDLWLHSCMAAFSKRATLETITYYQTACNYFNQTGPLDIVCKQDITSFDCCTHRSPFSKDYLNLTWNFMTWCKLTISTLKASLYIYTEVIAKVIKLWIGFRARPFDFLLVFTRRTVFISPLKAKLVP
jgi:hypothetical protein